MLRYYRLKNHSNYEITKYGMIRNRKTKNIKKAFINYKGYYHIRLKHNEKGWRSERVHRLVALTFVHNPNPIEFVQINHKDANKLNNFYRNLEWCNNSINQIHAYKTGLQKGNKKRTIEIDLKIDELRLKGLSYRKIGKIVNLSGGAINHYFNRYKK